MNYRIVSNLFEFWKEIGIANDFFHKNNGIQYTMPDINSWPSKVFISNLFETDLTNIHRRIVLGELPGSLNALNDPQAEDTIISAGFQKQSELKSMALNLSKWSKPEMDFTSIKLVNSEELAINFANIATQSFGYRVLESTIINLIRNARIKLFIGKYNEEYASCGMIFLDRNGESGIHMIGTLSRHRGHGLGKIMTQKLIHEAYKNKSKYVLLVASKLGEPIYSKIGFKTYGRLINYSV